LVSVIGLSPEGLLEIVECLDAGLLEFSDPAHIDFVDGDGVEIVQFLAASFRRGDQIGLLQQIEMLGHRLTAHVMALAEFRERLAVLPAQPVEQLTPAGIGKGFEHFVFIATMIGLYATI
jgi:hypothetical protein